MNPLSIRLRQLREHRGLTVRELAELIGKTAGYVSRIEGRGEIPSPDLICKLAGVYHVDVSEMFELAKQSQLSRAAKNISDKYASALALYRKEKK